MIHSGYSHYGYKAAASRKRKQRPTEARSKRGTGFDMRMARSIIGVAAGYAVFALSAVFLFHATGRDPHAEQDVLFAAGAIVYGMAFAALGGLISALIAGRRPVLHSGVMGAILALGALVSLLSRPGQGAIWSQLSAILLMAPSALAGGAASRLVAQNRALEPTSRRDSY
jgi:hypothetical protein